MFSWSLLGLCRLAECGLEPGSCGVKWTLHPPPPSLAFRAGDPADTDRPDRGALSASPTNNNQFLHFCQTLIYFEIIIDVHLILLLWFVIINQYVLQYGRHQWVRNLYFMIGPFNLGKLLLVDINRMGAFAVNMLKLSIFPRLKASFYHILWFTSGKQISGKIPTKSFIDCTATKTLSIQLQRLNVFCNAFSVKKL